MHLPFLSEEGPHWRSASYRQNRASRGRNDFVRGSDWQMCCLAAAETSRASHAKDDEVRFPMIGDCQDLIGRGTLPNYTVWFAPGFAFRRHDLPQVGLSRATVFKPAACHSLGRTWYTSNKMHLAGSKMCSGNSAQL
jgi:hypothetical protein